jgi:hypothetical protein
MLDKYNSKVGRPTKYKPYFCKLLLEYFDREPTKEIVSEIWDKKTGKIEFVHSMVPNEFPSLAGFAAKYGIHRDTINGWENAKDKNGKLLHPEFSDTIKRVKEIQEHILLTNAMTNGYAQPFAIFFAKNNLGYSDKTETDITSKGKSINIGVTSYKKNE